MSTRERSNARRRSSASAAARTASGAGAAVRLTAPEGSISTAPASSSREEPPQPEVLRAIEEDRLRRLAVAPGAADLLVVGVERVRDRRVVDPPHVGLVDAHAERGGGGDGLQVAGHEPLLHGVALARAKAGVVRGGGDSALAQRGRQL